ncbi:cation diffusion facilitator family transporter [Psychroflexus sp. CAK57W]|uniref:cation diffusion facilitator family transporter n=1 Tax=Psychroflexus curvus TaxID=2873595 RepID=UPI001CCDDE89|nr:cation diffusion facilitator family transporter [Psychroflexus curvus]MBZ9786926.1 cation diffusion facilitator family transporter [Psychroflexus curvus]
MSHTHSHPNSQKNLLFSIILNIVITVSQVVGGFLSGSLALLSDALHNFTDVVSLIISYVASKFSAKSATSDKTFGYKRAEIMAAFVNSASLIIIAVILIKESFIHFFNPRVINSDLVIWLSALAIVGNGLSVLLLLKDRKTNMNLTSAYFHLLTDMLASVAVLAGGLLMKFYGVYWVDSVLTFLIAVYLIFVGVNLFKNSFKVLMLYTPTHIEIEDIVTKINALPLVKNMHHVHIWQLNENELHLEAEIDFEEDITLSKFDKLLVQIEKILLSEYGINHITIQPEFDKSDNKNIIVQD